MSFSTETKDELARTFPEKKCCQMSELAALVRMDGTITINPHRQLGLYITTENAAVARKIFKLAKKVFNVDTEIGVQKKVKLKKQNLYMIRLIDPARMEAILAKLGIINDGLITPEIKKNLIRKICCRRAYLRGAFLGAGSVNNPEGNYHLEIITNNIEYAQSLVDLMNKFEQLTAKISSRKTWHVVYLKESEQIVAFLNIIGAHQALLSFENVRIVKGVRNKVNRLVNCETANLTKTVTASMRQVEKIRFIDDVIGLEKLSPRLRNLALLRVENPEISLKELGDLMDPPIGKSGVNHRMRKIEELADEMLERIEKLNKKFDKK